MEEFGWFNPGIETCGSSGLTGQNGPTHGPSCQVLRRGLRGLIRTESNSIFSCRLQETMLSLSESFRIFQISSDHPEIEANVTRVTRSWVLGLRFRWLRWLRWLSWLSWPSCLSPCHGGSAGIFYNIHFWYFSIDFLVCKDPSACCLGFRRRFSQSLHHHCSNLMDQWQWVTLRQRWANPGCTSAGTFVDFVGCEDFVSCQRTYFSMVGRYSPFCLDRRLCLYILYVSVKVVPTRQAHPLVQTSFNKSYRNPKSVWCTVPKEGCWGMAQGVPIGPCQVFLVVWMILQQSWMCFCSPTNHPKAADIILLGVLSLNGCRISCWHCFIHLTSGFSPRKEHRGLQHSVTMCNSYEGLPHGCGSFILAEHPRCSWPMGKVELRWHDWDILGSTAIVRVPTLPYSSWPGDSHWRYWSLGQPRTIPRIHKGWLKLWPLTVQKRCSETWGNYLATQEASGSHGIAKMSCKTIPWSHWSIVHFRRGFASCDVT